MSSYTYFNNLQVEVPETPPDSIVSRTLHDDEQSRVILFSFAPGQELSEHTASKAAMLYFVQGEADLTLGDDPHPAQIGTWVHMHPKLPHSVRAKTLTVMLLLMFK